MRKWKHRDKTLLVATILLALLLVLPSSVKQVSAYVIIVDNAVDADSTEDAQSNIGDDGATSYTDAQSQDDSDQTIAEGNGAGYVAGVDIDELHDAIANTQNPINTGTYSNDANMLAKDGTDNLLTEGQGAGYVAASDTGDDYVDTFSDTQTPTDVGSHTNSANLQATDGSDDTLEEAQGSGYVAPNDIEDYLDSTTNTQDPTDLGTYVPDDTNLYAVDGSDVTLTEENTGGAGGSEWLDVNAFDSTMSEWDNLVGASPYLQYQDEPTNYAHEEKTNGAELGWFNFPSTTLTGSLSVNVSAYARNDDGAGNDRIKIFVDYTGSGSGVDVGEVGDHTTYSYDTIDLGSHTVAEVNALRIYLQIYVSPAADDVYIDHLRIGVSVAGGDNYEFDREFSFSSLDTDEVNEYLCIYTGTIGTETLDIDIWDSAAWTDIGTDIVDANDDTWVNISISSWLDSATEYFRFQGSIESSDTTENTWGLDGILIHSWTDEVNDYELELEFAFASLTTDETNEYLCIYTGTIGDEELDILVWTGSWTDIGTNILTTNDDTWVNISITTWLDSAAEYFVFRGTSESGDGTQSTFGLDSVLIHSWTDAVDDYEFDREFTFTSLDFDNLDGEYLTIFTGTVGTETLDLYIWDSAAWVQLSDSIEDADDNVWINISISAYLDATTEYFSFRDSNQASEGTENTWEIDYVGIHTWTTEVLDYELNWEHQVTDVDTWKYDHVLTIYGQATGGDSETFSIHLWNSSDTTWYDTAQDIGTGEAWYNWTITDAFDDCIGSSITYRFTGNDEAADSTQSTLNLDYSGIRSYNFSVYGLPNFNILEYSPDDQYHAFGDSPLSFVVESGMSYKVQILATDTTGTAIANGWIYFDTDSDPSGSTVLTTSLQDLYLGQSAGNNTHQVWLWVNTNWTPGDSPITVTSYQIELNVTISGV